MELRDTELVENTLSFITGAEKVDAEVKAILFTTEDEVSISDVGWI